MQLRDIAKGDCQSSVSHIPVSRIPLLLADAPAQVWAFRCIDAGQPSGERLTRLTHPDRGPITSREDGGTNDHLDADG